MKKIGLFFVCGYCAFVLPLYVYAGNVYVCEWVYIIIL